MLAKLEQAKLLLAECQTIGEAKVAMDIGTIFAAMRAWHGGPSDSSGYSTCHGIRADRFVK